MSHDTAFIALDEPQKFRTIHDVELALDDLLPETSFTPPQLARIAAVAREKHADRRTQTVAILDVAAQEVAGQQAPESPGLRALDAFRAEFGPQVRYESGAPLPWLERNRPHWSDPAEDYANASAPTVTRWHSVPVTVPLTGHTSASTADGGLALAGFTARLAQCPIDREPHVVLAYTGWRPDGTSSAGRSSFDVRLEEAAALARALLLLIDVAREEVGGE
ncbi:hypothetical protein FK530_09320 [Tsukamurella conjunctivitidis]|uniref:Uncharacterized protein n=1 Tax=Tsukamurella conjunctivitidis TaxID=2592068 RepID=A0A5C5S1S9_9ACTN|nr:hypothetical protein [Tsukamurella conjunctivitidis]TWS29014.1 hypothetical protein FK530_09320 [Tsukamurella conjunctivitidis]